MAIFQYTARTAEGKIKRGQEVGHNEGEIQVKLRQRELQPVKISDISNLWLSRLFGFLRPIKTKDLVIFSRQFSVMISANVTVVESLNILVDQTKNLALRNMIAEIAFEVDSGSFLSDAFAKRPNTFSNFFVNIIRSGETSGKLDEVLNYLSDEMEKSYDMIAKIRGAMIYPVFIMSGLIGVGIVLMIYVIPNLTSILTESNAALPFSTRIVIAASNFLRHYLWLVIVILAVAGFLFRLYIKTYAGRRNLDLFKLRLPIFGTLFKYIYLMRFARSLSTLLKGGVTITRSLEITADVVNNTIYKELILETLEAINDGNPLASVLETSRDVPRMVPQMITVGEKTGKIDVVLDRITSFYTRESTNMLDNLSKLMEPVIMVIMGIGVGIMVAAVIMPMYNLASQF